MKPELLKSLKVKIAFLFSLLIAIAFAINWFVAVRTIHGEKIVDLEKVLEHILVESKDEYIPEPLTPLSDLSFLHVIPHNLLILKDSEASHVRFIVAGAPYVPNQDEVGSSIPMDNGMYLSIVSDQEKIDASVQKYGEKLFGRYLVSLLGILLISFILLQRYMKPLGALAEHARKWQSGDSFECNLDNPGQEIDELSHAFTALVHRLEGFRKKEKALFKEMAHELKTPIAIMRARLDVYENSDRITKEQIVRQLGHDIERLMSELKNVLFFESSDFEDSTEFQVADVLEEVLHKVEILAQPRGLNIFVCNESFVLSAPRKLFLKVMTGLIENALTYAKEKSEIKINVDPDQKMITILNHKGEKQYLFSSKIGQKMLDRISAELGIGYRITDQSDIYRIDVYVLAGSSN